MTTTTQHPFDLLVKFDQRSRHSLQGHEATAVLQGQLALRLRGWYLTLTMDNVFEIIPVHNITRVPGVKPWLLGIANLRGTVITVIDLGQFLGVEAATVSHTQRIIVVHDKDWYYGLQIDEILGLRHFDSEREITLNQALVKPIDSYLKPYLKTAFADQEQTWLGLDINSLISDHRFLDAAA